MVEKFKDWCSERPIARPTWLMVFLVVAGLNFLMGYEIGGFLMAMAFVSIAVLGAYAASEVKTTKGPRQAGLVLMVVLQLVLGQWCGWATIGINLSKGSAALESKAGTHNSSNDALKMARDELALLGPQRPADAVAADRNLECSRTGKNYKDGRGPKCTALIAEEAKAKRYVELQEKLPELTAALAAGPQIKDADAGWVVPQAFGGAVASWYQGKTVTVTADQVQFAFAVFLTAMLEFIATCGPWLFDLRFVNGGPQLLRLEHLVSAGAAAHPVADSIVAFRAEMLETRPGVMMTEQELCEAYFGWELARHREPMARAVFLRLFEATGVRRHGEHFLGVRFKQKAA
ncbi:MAG: hypothetical protein ACRCS9_13870 [Hyphomicrobium sp.]